MASVDVGLTPAEIPPGDVAVVVDVLRATSTIVQALDAGYRRVLCCDSLDAARSLRGDGRVLAGERKCMRAPDFELGNSPAAIASQPPLGEELVLATTNGSPAIVAASERFDRVLIGCLLNLRATVAAIPSGARLAIVCSGTDGRAALEDIYLAGRIVEQLQGRLYDGGRIALCVAGAYDDALEPLAASADGAVLEASGQTRDIAWCAEESTIDLVPEVTSASDQATTVSLVAAAEPRQGNSNAKRDIAKTQ
ncbi:MAG: 2-phosphosulfolactate phosphatase [Actinomycetota bacterium]|nr:2-phosphosulfolactate phosphatase [Actinomycetota bacterium]